MDFKLVFERLLALFHENKVRYGLIGGFALGLHGVSRSTLDIDFFVHRDDLSNVDIIMKELGYPFIKYGKVDIDRYIDFLNCYNEFINHRPKTFKRIKDGIMLL